MRFDWLISDTHLLHARICEYEPSRKAWCDGTVAGMTEALITAWQGVVKPDDHVLHLGDFAMGHKTEWAGIRARLPGDITIVRGNHDPGLSSRHWEALEPIQVCDSISFFDPRFGRIVCRHDPADFTVAEGVYFDVLLHGHLHSGHHRDDVNGFIRAKCACASVERLPSQPAPLAFDRLGELLPKEPGA